MFYSFGGATVLLILSCMVIVDCSIIEYADRDLDIPLKRDFWGNSLSMMESSRRPCAVRRCRRYQDCCHGFTCTKYQTYNSLNAFGVTPMGRCKRIYNEDYFQFR